MPKFILNQDDYQHLKKEMLAMGYKEINSYGLQKKFGGNFRFIPPRPTKGRETGFIFEANGLTALVWTTWLNAEEVAREKDSGWVLILEKGQARHFEIPLRRTKNFVWWLLIRARVEMFKVANRPRCLGCGRYMDITYGLEMKDRYWSCEDWWNHPDRCPNFKDWHCGLPDELKKIVRSKEEAHLRYVNKLKKEGKDPYAELFRRKQWKREEIRGLEI